MQSQQKLGPNQQAQMMIPAAKDVYVKFRGELEQLLGMVSSDKVKQLIAQDQFTQLRGEVIDLKQMEIQLSQLGQTDNIRDYSLVYDPEQAREIFLL